MPGKPQSHKTNIGSKPVLGIRARLILLALLAVVPLMLDRVRVLEATRTEQLESAAAEAMEMARRAAEEQNGIFLTARALLQSVALAYISAAPEAMAQGCASYLDGFTKDIQWVRSLSVINAEGRIICSTWLGALGLDVSDRAYFRDAMQSRHFVLSDYLVTRTRKEPTIMAAYPAETKNSEKILVIAPVDLEWMARMASTVGRRAGITVSLIDGKGTIIARHPDAGNDVGLTPADHPLIGAMRGHSAGSLTAPDFDGTRRIFAFVPVPWSQAHLAVGLDEAEVLHRIDQQIYLAYAQLAFFGLLTLLAAWLVGERLVVAPIRLLADRAARFGGGEFDLPIQQNSWIAEFGSLAAALDDMARKLAQRERELQAANYHLAELASSDGLSGLANRRGFDAKLQAEWLLAAELKRPIGLLMVDVDHFKLFNDRYGHVEGDNCLRRIGGVIAAISRGEADFSARYGGEEFVLLLPGANLEKAVEIAERLRRSVESLSICNAEAMSGHMTISLGVASFVPEDDEPAEKLVEAADAALYAAKRRGRNTVVAHAPVILAEAS
jgi:diguanylate cyclase (GGDEF)-like protein